MAMAQMDLMRTGQAYQVCTAMPLWPNVLLVTDALQLERTQGLLIYTEYRNSLHISNRRTLQLPLQTRTPLQRRELLIGRKQAPLFSCTATHDGSFVYLSLIPHISNRATEPTHPKWQLPLKKTLLRPVSAVSCLSLTLLLISSPSTEQHCVCCMFNKSLSLYSMVSSPQWPVWVWILVPACQSSTSFQLVSPHCDILTFIFSCTVKSTSFTIQI